MQKTQLIFPKLITFDFFGTVLDWKSGLENGLANFGIELKEGEFDKVIDYQSSLELGAFRKYADITTESLVNVIGLLPSKAVEISSGLGNWPLFPDSKEGLRKLLYLSRCAATTNSDLIHGHQIQKQLGFSLSGWFCAEEMRVYKPNRKVWEIVASKMNISFGPSWWHVSAYADYDHKTAQSLGLTTVFIKRPHCREAKTDFYFDDLSSMVATLEESKMHNSIH
jgi:2-haloacid dehalogenase